MAEVVIDMTETMPEQEKELGREVSMIERQATAVVISNDADYADAGKFARDIKTAQKRVETYWEPMRVTTYNAYKSVTDHKKAMIDPLKNAETIMKRKMSAYIMEQEKKRREEEERLRRLAQEELDRKLAEAAKAESEGDVLNAEFAMAEAEAIDNLAASATVRMPEPKATGISYSSTWKINRIDVQKLPDFFNGIQLKKPDESEILRLIKASKGMIQIPGVEYEETKTMTIRAS